MGLFGKKKDDDEQSTAESDALGQQTSEQDAVDGSDQATAVRPTPTGSFIPDSAAPAPEPQREQRTAVSPTVPPAAEAKPPVEPKPAAPATPAPAAAPKPAATPTPSAAPRPAPAPAAATPRPPSAAQSPLEAQRAAEGDPFDEKPELFVGAAFVGGFLVAQVIKWMGGDDE